jgi:hypothetical protein
MVCPECGLNHEEGSSQCLGWEGEASRPVEFIPLAEMADADAFQAVALRLEEEGIPWFIQSEPPLGLGDPGGPVAMIYVAETSFRHACRTLEQVRPVAAAHKS